MWPACAAKIVGISVAIIATLFLIQQFGTGFVGSIFSPVVMIWLLLELRYVWTASVSTLQFCT